MNNEKVYVSHCLVCWYVFDISINIITYNKKHSNNNYILGFRCPWRVRYLTKYNYCINDSEHKVFYK